MTRRSAASVRPTAAEHLVDAPAGCSPVTASTRRWLRAGAAGMEGGVLEHGADVGARAVELLVAAAAERRRARGRPDEAEQRAQRRALARAVGTEEAGDAAGLDVEAEAVDRVDRAEPLVQVTDLDLGHGAG